MKTLAKAPASQRRELFSATASAMGITEKELDKTYNDFRIANPADMLVAVLKPFVKQEAQYEQ